MAFLLTRCIGCITVGTEPGPESYYKRNRYLVDHADYLVAVYDNEHRIRSGTVMTTNYAKKMGIPVVLIHPDTGTVSYSSN